MKIEGNKKPFFFKELRVGDVFISENSYIIGIKTDEINMEKIGLYSNATDLETGENLCFDDTDLVIPYFNAKVILE